MSVDHVDQSWDHLYPEFRRKLTVVLKETADHLGGEEWVLVEGFRSQARQDWLYAQGRTRPGPKVTWMKFTRWHGAGLAADVMPAKHGYRAAREWWEMLLHVGKSHGLSNPAFEKGDLGHLQLGDEKVRNLAVIWVKNGFKEDL